MKKLPIALASFALVLSVGTAAFAAGNSHSGHGMSFENMLPFMQKMHPDSSKKELKDMYKSCHEKMGKMHDSMKDMMN